MCHVSILLTAGCLSVYLSLLTSSLLPSYSSLPLPLHLHLSSIWIIGLKKNLQVNFLLIKDHIKNKKKAMHMVLCTYGRNLLHNGGTQYKMSVTWQVPKIYKAILCTLSLLTLTTIYGDIIIIFSHFIG